MFLTSRFLWLNLLLKNIVMKKRTSWFLSVAVTIIVLMGGGYAALRHSRTQVHALSINPCRKPNAFTTTTV